MAPPNLTLLNVFVQVNTIRGFRYLDDAGKIMNLWDSEFPQKEVGLQGLTMSNQDSKIRSFQANTEKVWIHIELPDTLTYAMDQARTRIQAACDIMGVTTFKRLGLRLNYLMPTAGQKDFQVALFDRTFSPSVRAAVEAASERNKRAFDLHIQLVQANLKVDFRLAEVQRAGSGADSSHLPEAALMVDPDISREGEFSFIEFRRFLRDGEEWLGTVMPTLVPAFLPEG